MMDLTDEKISTPWMNPILPFINFHTHHKSDIDGVITVVNVDLAIKEAWSPDFEACSVGIHPWHINKHALIQQFFQLEDACKKDNVIAVGEAGLDKQIEIPLELQTKVLEQQIEIADFYSKPIIIHCVGAYYELIVIRKKLKTNIPFIIHGFNKNAQVMKDLLNNGFYFSIGTAIIHTSASLQSAISELPLDRLLLETDNKNTPIQGVYLAASALYNLELDQMKQIINDNYKRILKFQ